MGVIENDENKNTNDLSKVKSLPINIDRFRRIKMTIKGDMRLPQLFEHEVALVVSKNGTVLNNIVFRNEPPFLSFYQKIFLLVSGILCVGIIAAALLFYYVYETMIKPRMEPPVKKHPYQMVGV